MTAIVSFSLFLTLFLAPQLIFMLFAVEGNESAYFLSRRAAMLFLGYAVMSYLARHAKHSLARQAIILGIGSAMLSLALLGIFELSRGFTSFGILSAVGAEFSLAVAYFSLWFSNRGKAYLS